jgi:hypothetical protein
VEVTRFINSSNCWCFSHNDYSSRKKLLDQDSNILDELDDDYEALTESGDDYEELLEEDEIYQLRKSKPLS